MLILRPYHFQRNVPRTLHRVQKPRHQPPLGLFERDAFDVLLQLRQNVFHVSHCRDGIWAGGVDTASSAPVGRTDRHRGFRVSLPVDGRFLGTSLGAPPVISMLSGPVAVEPVERCRENRCASSAQNHLSTAGGTLEVRKGRIITHVWFRTGRRRITDVRRRGCPFSPM